MSDRVVPVSMEVRAMERDGGELVVGDFSGLNRSMLTWAP